MWHLKILTLSECQMLAVFTGFFGTAESETFLQFCLGTLEPQQMCIKTNSRSLSATRNFDLTSNYLSMKNHCFVPLNHFTVREGLHWDPLFHFNFLLWWKFALSEGITVLMPSVQLPGWRKA